MNRKEKRLFALRRANGTMFPSNKTPMYFPDKQQAKRARNAQEEVLFVTPGPDHWRAQA